MSIVSKPASNAYRDGWSQTFAEGKDEVAASTSHAAPPSRAVLLARLVQCATVEIPGLLADYIGDKEIADLVARRMFRL